ncbi:polygalacturonase QRT3 [Ipomoea triloba]|uniref:polygalacturonase QRT3 n=1 Tax=Ipomoea triloba TaxID=35885 RepID=UPI00125E7E00|nr:polygalacturonase QRT3 [Ipomoea triloba]
MQQPCRFPLLALLVVLLVNQAQCSPRQLKVQELQNKLDQRFLYSTQSPHPSNPTKIEGRVLYPIGYGADPTGEDDSSSAIMEALDDALKSQKNGAELLPGVKDLGGLILDFQGGDFRISHPIIFPPGVGNIVVQGGTLRASNKFPGDRHLIELEVKDQNGRIHYEDVTFRDILFDSSLRGGGLLVVDSARIRVTNCFFLHFTTQGILVRRGHETFITHTFLGQHPTVGGSEGEKDFSGTAVDLASTDNAVTDVAIFSAATGIVLRGQSNIITGVHCYNKASTFGGVGILVKAAQNRIDNCYLDYNSIVIEDPSRVHVTNGYFLGDGNVILKSVSGRISGLNIVNNMFIGEPMHMLPIVQIDGSFKDVDQVVIDQNHAHGMRLKSTAGKLTVAGDGTKWVADFSPVLVFPNRITHFQYSFYSRGVAGFPAHAVTNVSGNVVVVESEKPVQALVSIFVDQNNIFGDRNIKLY